MDPFEQSRLMQLYQEERQEKQNYLISEIANKINPYLLSEHEVDSLAINYTLLDYIRYNQVILLMLY